MLNFLTIFFVILLKYLIMNTKGETVLLYTLNLAIIIILCIFTIVGKIYTKKIPEIKTWSISIFVFAGFALGMTFLSKDGNFLIPFLLSITYSYDDIKSIIKPFFLCSLLFFFFQIFLFFIGFAQGKDLYRYVDGEILIRSSMGFDSPNAVFLYFLPIMLCVFYLTKTGRQKIISYLFIIFIATYIYIMTNSRSSLVTTVIIILADLFFSNTKGAGKSKFRKIIPFSFFLFFVFSIITANIFGRDPSNSVNVFFTGRPYIWYSYLSQGIHLIGTGSKVILPDSIILPQYGNSLDNYYIYFLHCYGLLPVLLQGFFYYFFFKKALQANQQKLVVILIIYLSYGFVEANTIIPSINVSLIYLFAPLFNSEYFSSSKNLDHQRILIK